MIEAHHVSTNIGDIFKHVNLPKFDGSNIKHRALADVVRQAHHEHDSKKRARIVTQARAVAAQLIEMEISPNTSI